MAGTADTGADSEVLPVERSRLLDEHPHLREPRPSRPTDGRLPLHGGYGWFIRAQRQRGHSIIAGV
jgi:hypothetical protein